MGFVGVHNTKCSLWRVCAWCYGPVCSVCTSLVGLRVHVLSNEIRKWTHDPLTDLLSALDCLLRTDSSCKRTRMEDVFIAWQTARSVGRFALASHFFVLSIFLSLSSPSLLCFILIYNLPETVDSHSLTAQRIIEGVSGACKKTRPIHREELLAQGPLMSHWLG